MQINGKEICSISDESLTFHQQDLKAVIQAQRTMVNDGMLCPKLSQYETELDEVNKEIYRRQGGGLKWLTPREKELTKTLKEVYAIVKGKITPELDQKINKLLLGESL